jgi:phosphoribosylformylglycinamidine synthase
MILFFGDSSVQVFAVKCNQPLPHPQKEKLSWLFGDQPLIDNTALSGLFYGPRATMVTPWSTNAVEITQNMGLVGIERIEVYEAKSRVQNP